VQGVRSDLDFRPYLESTRRKLLPDMVRYASLLRTAGINPRQLDVLNDFGRAWRGGELGLDPAEIQELIELGYLIRDPQHCAAEKATLDSSVERGLKAALKYEAAGKLDNAAQCRAKVQKLQRRIETRMLMITPAGKAVVRLFPLSGIRQ
jgi:hypothetical protein